MVVKKGLILLVSLMILMTSTGCWGKRELNELGIVTATGVDREPDGSIRITVVSVQPSGGQRQSAQMRSNAWVGTATGPTLMDASKNLRSIATRNLVWFHSRLIVIGEEMARYGINEVLDFFARNREIRFSGYVLITDTTAMDMLLIPADIQSNLADELKGIINNKDEWSKTYVATLKELLVSLSQRGKGKGSVTGRLGYYDSLRDTFSASRENKRMMSRDEEKLGIAFLKGAAALKEDKLVGWLEEKETRGCMLITNKVKGGSVVVPGMEGQGEYTIEIKRAKSKVTPQIQDHQVSMKVELLIVGRVIENTSKDGLDNQQVIRQVEEKTAEELKKEMELAVKKAQKELDTDIFGFGGSVQREYPKAWKEMESEWSEIFPKVKIEYDVRVDIKRMGAISETIMTE